MDVNKVTLCWPNRTDQGALLGGGWTVGLPLANLQNRIIAKKARSTSASNANTQFYINLDKVRSVFSVALIGHNMSDDAQFRVRFYSDYDKSGLIHDSGLINVWPATYTQTDLEWEDVAWWSGDNSLDTTSDFTPLAYYFADMVYQAKSVSVELFDSANSIGYVEVGRLFVSGGWQPEFNMQYGVQYGYIVGTGVDEALDGTEYFNRKRSRRTMNMAIHNMQSPDAFGQMYSMQRDMGIDQEILVAANLLGVTESYYTTFVGRNSDLDPLSNPYYNRFNINLNIREIL